MEANTLRVVWTRQARHPRRAPGAGAGGVLECWCTSGSALFVATRQFQSTFDVGRVERCVLPVFFNGKVVHLFVVSSYQGADSDSEELLFTEALC